MRNFGSIMLIVILTVLTPVMLLVSSIKFNVVTPKFLKHELSSQNAYQIAISQLDAALLKIEIDPQYPITHQELITLAHKVFTENWLRQNVEGVIDGVFAWLNAPMDATLAIPIDLRQPKSELTTGADELLAAKLPMIKPCPKKKGVRSEDQGICQFAGLTLPQLKEQLKHAGVDIASLPALLPDTLDLMKPDLSKIVGPSDASSPNSAESKSQEILTKLTAVKKGYHQALQYFMFAWIGYGVLVAGYIALNATIGWRRLVRWVGILAVSTGTIPAGIAIAAKILVEQTLLPQLRLGEDVPRDVQAVIPKLVMDVQNALFLSVLVIGIILVTLGLGSILESHFMPKPALAKRKTG